MSVTQIVLDTNWEALTMPDEVIDELWQIKDRMARQHGYEIDAFLAYLQSRQQVADRHVVDLRAMKESIQAASDKPRS